MIQKALKFNARTKENRTIAKFGFLTVVLLRINIFWDVTVGQVIPNVNRK